MKSSDNNFRNRLSNISAYWKQFMITDTVPAWWIGYARFIFGLILLASLWDYRNYFGYGLNEFKFFFTYDGFHWVKVLPQPYMHYFVFSLFIVYGCFTFGVFYKPIAIITALSQWYLFLLEKGHYNNHSYLYCLFALIFAFTAADKGFTIKTIKNEEQNRLPAWQMRLFLIQISIVYFYGGLAKINVDWLQGFPMRYWLQSIANDYNDYFFASFLRTPYAAYLYSWVGMFFDLLVPVALWNSKWKWRILPFVLFFHISNHFFFDIGTFPMAMIGFTALFFFKENKNSTASATNVKVLRHDYSKKKLIIANTLLIVYISFQLLFPLRQFLWRGNPSWTGQGQYFAWRMMLVDTIEGTKIRIRIPEQQVDFYVDIALYINQRQYFKSSRTPVTILKFIEMLKAKLAENNVLDKANIYLEMYKSVNYRPPVLFNDTTLNYINVEYNPLVSQSWILPWKPSDAPLIYNDDRYADWNKLIEIQRNNEKGIMTP